MAAAPEQVTAMFSEEDHPRATSGPTGGQFTKKGSGGENSSRTSTSKPRKGVPAKTTPKRQRRVIPAGALGFDGVRGTGYGVKGGDKRVRSLQEELNRLGLTDSRGRKLRIDGQLGPLTTQAIQAAQLRLGMRPTGIIAPAFIDRLKATKALPPAKKAAPRKPVRAKFDPMQKRDSHGQWSVGGALQDFLHLGDRIQMRDGETLAGSGRLDSKSGTGIDVVWAAIDSPGGRQIRLGTVSDPDAQKWRAANKGATAPLSADEVAGLRDDLATAEAKGKELADEAERIYSAGDTPTDPVLLGTEPVADGRIDSAWGPVEWSVWLDDSEPTSYTAEFKVGGDQSADSVHMDPAELSGLIHGLDGVVSTPVAASRVLAAELRGIELARPGKWKLASGPMTVTKQHLIDAARYATRKGARPGYVKIGHNDPRFAVGDGEPALGWVHNVRYAEDEHGPKLLGDIHGMPDWLAAAAPTAWPDRSIEGWADFTDEDGERYALVVDGVALLGVTPPGMSSIQSLRDLPKAVGVAAASGVRVVASMASAPVAVEEGAGQMDPAITRKALGLSADAPDDEVASALEAAATALRGDPAPAPVQASLFGDEPKPKAPAAQAPAIPQGMMLVSASVWQQREDTIRSLTDYREETRRNERDEYIARAVQAGKFTPAQRADFIAMWDGNPEATRAYIDKLVPNSALAVMASGYAGEVVGDDFERQYQAMVTQLSGRGY